MNGRDLKTQELGEENTAELLEKTLDEEKETDAKLTELAEQINASANSEVGGEETEMDEDEEEQEEPQTTTIRKGKSRSANA